MLGISRREFTVASLLATVAVILAMVGGAWAAQKYLITSVKQISPSVLKKLKGRNGATGPVGAPGPAGAQGANGSAGPAGATGTTGATGAKGSTGPTGPTGTFGSDPLPKEESLTGVWGTSGGEGDLSLVAITFASRLPSAPTVYYLNSENEGTSVSPAGVPAKITKATFETQCTGTATAPAAKPGFLCLYQIQESEAKFNEPAIEFVGAFSSNVSGVVIPFSIVGAGGRAFGTWAVTAP